MWDIRRFIRKALRMRSWLIGASCIVVIFGATFFVYMLEPKTFGNPFQAFWWVMVTITTIGYGDVYPHTTGGEMVGIFLFIFGIGLAGVMIGKIVDTFGIFRRRRKEGKLTYKGEDHIVIIGWSRKAQYAIEEVLASNKAVDIVLVDTLEETPILAQRVYYIQGEAAEDEVLEQANLKKAKSVLIFADDKIHEPQICDGKSLMIVTTIEQHAPGIHSIVEVMDERHIKNFHFVHVNEFILMNQTVSRLAVRSAFMNGVSEVYRQLMSRQQGENIYRIEKRPNWHTYGDAFEELLKKGATLVADHNDLGINCRLEEPIQAEAKLYVICDNHTYHRLEKGERNNNDS